MKNSKSTALWILIALFSLTLNGYFIFKRGNGENHAAGSPAQAPEVYVCPMHPQVVSDRPADCPICGMKLVKKQQSEGSDPEQDSLIGTVKLSPTQELLANISVEHPLTVHFDDRITVSGSIKEIEGRRWKASARAMGRIEKLYVSDPGQRVNRGDPLFDLYSPDIASAAQEYLFVLENLDDDTTGVRLEATRAKLLSLGLEFEHLAEIERLKLAFDVWTFRAIQSGVVMEKMSSEGEWAMPGMAVIEFLDLSSVYVEGSLLERDAAAIRPGSKVTVKSVSGETGDGEITLIGPMADMMTRTIPFRAVLSNPHGRWTPGMFVTVGAGGGNGYNALSLPEEAVLSTGRGSYIWIKVGEGRFATRKVSAGARKDGRIAILDGLEPYEAAAVTGAYLIDSDAQIRAIGTGHRHGDSGGDGESEMDVSLHDSHNGHEDDQDHAGHVGEAPPSDSQASNDACCPPETGSPSLSKIKSSTGSGAISKFSYTCPMHPDVHSSEPGRCPDCGMFLVQEESGK